MGPNSKSAEYEVARHKSGPGDDSIVDQKIATVWKKLVQEQLDETAKVLAVDPASLDAAKPPFRAETLASGISGVEIAIWFLGGIMSESVKDLASEAGKAAAKKAAELWTRHMEKHLLDPRDPVLGARIDEDM